MSRTSFSSFVKDFTFCVEALSGITEVFGNWWDGYSFNIFVKIKKYDKPLPFLIFTSPKKSVIIHVPYMRKEAGELLLKMLQGLGYKAYKQKEEYKNITRAITKIKQFSILFDEQFLADSGGVDD